MNDNHGVDSAGRGAAWALALPESQVVSLVESQAACREAVFQMLERLPALLFPYALGPLN